VRVSAPDYSAELAGRLSKLEAAISKQRTIRFSYWTPQRDKVAERTLNPYALRLDEGIWYVVGHDLDRAAVRTFRVSRNRSDIRFATRRADADLAARREVVLDLDRLAEIANEALGEPEAGRTMRRLRRLQALQHLDQPVFLLVGVEAAIDRALTEGWSMVLEGVHIVPGMISVDRAVALIVQCVVAITDEDLHRSHVWVRDAATDGLRPLEKYLDGMTEIRMIQDVLLERARRFDVPVIENTSLDDAVGQMLDLVLTGAERLARV
jgi:hypothetical protein